MALASIGKRRCSFLSMQALRRVILAGAMVATACGAAVTPGPPPAAPAVRPPTGQPAAFGGAAPAARRAVEGAVPFADQAATPAGATPALPAAPALHAQPGPGDRCSGGGLPGKARIMCAPR